MRITTLARHAMAAGSIAALVYLAIGAGQPAHAGYGYGYSYSYAQTAYGTLLNGNVRFVQNLAVTGTLFKGSGTFVIDHPLYPLTKLLFHSFVESPDAKNIYDGVIQLDARGEATIEFPHYFEALNQDFRYQFFPHEEPMPNLYVKKEVSGNSFVIAGGVPHGEISWQVTGNRHDPYILSNPIIPEVRKSSETIVKPGECLFEPLCY